MEYMSVYKNTPEVEVRERRLHSTLSYNGDAADLIEKSKNRQLSTKTRYYSQCSNCAEGCAETTTLHIRDAAVVGHAPIGCASGASMANVTSRSVTTARGQRLHAVKYISTNIQEKDTVFGASEKLRGAIAEADRRFQPKAIFIESSCASGIIGEDLESIASEAEAKLGYPVIPIYCEGFKSKIWSTGFDAAYHGILRRLVKPAEKKQEDLVNIFNFEGADTFSPLLKKVGLRVNYLAPLASVEDLAHISEAACSTQICETLATYVSAVLEEKYGVPEVNAPSPFGIDWTDRWLREIGKITHREEIVEQVIAEEHARIEPEIAELRKELEGKTAYVISGDSFAHNLGNIVKEFGVKLIGFNALHHDAHTDREQQSNTLADLVQSNGNIPNVSVCNKQPYQVAKIIKDIKPDFILVRHMQLTTLATKLGIPVLFEGDANFSSCYDGTLKMGRRLVEALKTKKLVENIAAHSEFPYTDWWMNEVDDPFYFNK